VLNVQPNVSNFGLTGMLFTGLLDVPAQTSGSLQIVIHVATQGPDGRPGAPVKSTLAAYATSDGDAATGTPLLQLNGAPVHTSWYAFLPYDTLVVPRGVRFDMIAMPSLYINAFGVKDGAPIPFFVTTPDQPNTQFYYSRNGQSVGPITFAEVGAKITTGEIDANTYIWRQGSPNWVVAKDVPEIGPLLNSRVQ